MGPRGAALIATVLVLVAVVLLPVQALPAGPGPAPPPPGDEALVDHLQQATSDGIRISYHSQTGKVRFIGTDRGYSIPRPEGVQPDANPEQVARSFLDLYGQLFGLRDQAGELAVIRSRAADGNRSFVRFQQVYQGIPVVGGELVVQVDAAKNVLSASGEVLPDLELDVAPTIEVGTARQTAARVVMKSYEVEEDSLTVTEPELWIYNPVLLNPGPNINELVWLMEVQSEEMRPIRELVLVDAHHGFVALHFNQIDTARNRIIYDNNNDPYAGLPGYGPARTEGQGSTGVSDIDQAYDYAGHTYDFYYNYHGRDSLDNAGMSLVSTTRYCPSPDPFWCPYSNAFWNGSQMVYGEGMAADDVVAHEMTHGVTDYESNLYYYYQSGAINEAFSDIWGEFVDLTNGAGNDDPGVRWLMGEDSPMGAIRDMADPPSYGDPDKISSPHYFCAQWDSGGVHINSGIANKIAYLLVDGDTFNSYTINPIGLTKTAKIFYETQTNWLTSASDYNDLYDDLYYACINLIGTAGITSSDCDQVDTALTATETDLPEPCDTRDEAPICDTGQPSYLFRDDFEDGIGNWTTGAYLGSDEWWYATFYAVSGNASLWGYDSDYQGDYYAAMIDDIALPADTTSYMHFAHSHQFEDSDYLGELRYWDGGVLEYSTNGGTSWYEAGGLIDHTGYSGTIYDWWGSPLGGRQAFVGQSNGYYSSRLDLTPLAGQDVRMRFRIGTDIWMGDRGWFIDDVGIYTCDNVHVYIPLVLKMYSGGAPPPPPPPGIYGTVRENGSPAAGVPVDLEFYNGSKWTTLLRATTGADGSYRFAGAPSLAPGQRYCVVYSNTEATPGRLWSWSAPCVTSYTAGTNRQVADFDIADITLVSPPDGDTVSLPFAFSWSLRPATPSDSYTLYLYEPIWGGASWSSSALGYLGSYQLNSLPSGFTTGKGYLWYVGVYTPGSGWGYSYRDRYVTFSNYGLGPLESAAPGETTPPEGFERPGLQRP